jgi:AraC-like DNA-binding protein
MQKLSNELLPEDALSCFIDSIHLKVVSAQVCDCTSPLSISVAGGTAGFCAVLHGRCYILNDLSGESHPLESGDLAILVSSGAHHVQDGFSETGYVPGVPMGSRTVLVCGTFSWDEKEVALLIPNMPPIIRIKGKSNSLIPRILGDIRMISEDPLSDQLGAHATIHHLAFCMLVQGIRARLCAAPSDQKHICEFMDHGQIGAALYMMHMQPEARWSLTSLAKQCGMSRSAFAEEFRRVAGQSPMSHLLEVRMHTACDLLSKTSLRIKEVSAHAGYTSPPAFCNAFKRLTGMAPGQYRKAWITEHAIGKIA